jgi:glycosyltransferase involved in cell wall biosynthesis
MRISTVIITQNSQKFIENCLTSVEPFSDEIIVVDSYSADQTPQMAKSFEKVKFYQRTFDGFITQKNYANSLAKGSHIFSLDSDEVVSKDLQNYFLSNISQLPDAAKIPRLNHIGNFPISAGNWYPEHKLRLWKNGLGYWAGEASHEYLVLNKNIKTITLKENFYHYNHESFKAMKIKSYKYIDLGAKKIVEKSNLLEIFFKMIFNPLIKFIKGYFIKMGFTLGLNGLILEYFIAWETFHKYRKAFLIKIKH